MESRPRPHLVRSQVQFEGKKASLFDCLEDLDYDACLERAQTIAGVSGSRPAGKMQAFVFLKPHAVTAPVKALVEAGLKKAGISVVGSGTIPGSEIDSRMLIDTHYGAIAAKAVKLKPSEPLRRGAADFSARGFRLGPHAKHFSKLALCCSPPAAARAASRGWRGTHGIWNAPGASLSARAVPPLPPLPE